MTNCPHAGVCPFQRMQPQGSVYATESTRRDRLATRGYHQQADALFPSSAAPDLQAGETLTTKTPMRAQSVIPDVAVPVLQALMYGTGAAALAGLLTAGLRWPWYIPLGTFAGVYGIAVFVTPAGARKLLMAVETWTGHDLDGDGAVGVAQPVTQEIVGRLVGERRSIYTQLEVRDPRIWHEFCKAVHGGRNFSGSEYERHGGDREEFNRILDSWASQDRRKALVDPASIGPRMTPEPTRRGRLMVKLFATTPPVAT